MKSIPYRWVIAITLFAAYSIQYLDRVKTNVLNPVIAHEVGLSVSDLGTGAFLMLLLLWAFAICLRDIDRQVRGQAHFDFLGYRLVSDDGVDGTHSIER